MEFLKDALTAEGPENIPILHVDNKNSQPLSVAQNSLWFVDRMMPGLQGYNLPSVFKLTGPLEVDVLERSLTEFIARHEILRATYSAENGEPVQNIAPAYAVKLEIVDMSDLSPISNETFFPLLRKETKTPFNLAQGPLFRIKFIRLGPEEHILFWMAHHMVWDGWSFDVMWDELAAIYPAFSKGLPCPLTPMTIQYGDFARWQQERLNKKDMEKQLEFWRKQLGGDLQALQMPLDKPRPPIRSYRGDRIRLDIPKPMIDSLKSFGDEENATLFMVLLAAYYVMLYRYTGQEDLSIGSPMWGRERPETERLIGFFTNTVVLRAHLEGGPSFREVIRRVKKVLFDASANQTIPFERIVEQLPQISKTPLFQTLFTYQDARNRPSHMGAIGIEQLPAPQTDVASFDMLLWFKETPTELMGRLDFSSDLFTHETMDEFMRHFKGLLVAAVEHPDISIAELPILSEEEQRQLLALRGKSAQLNPAARFPDKTRFQSDKTIDAIAAPHTPAEEYVAALWRKLLGKNDIGIFENFFEIGGYSLLAVEMFSRIQKKFRLNLPLATLFSAPTIKEIALLLQDHFNVDGRASQKKTSSGPQSAWKYAAPIKSSGNLHPFFCVHGVGGNVLNYYPLVSFFDKEQPLYGLQCRGVDGVSPLFGSVAVMAREYIKEIRQIQPHGPYFLGGGSMGGLVAFEMAQQLSSMNEPIGLLAMFDSVCPRLLKSGVADPAQKSAPGKPAKSLFARARHSVWCRIRDALKTANCLKYRLAGRPIPHELRYWLLGQKNLAISRRYSPCPYNGLITMFYATLNINCHDRYRGWESVAKGGMRFFDFSCTHETAIENVGVQIKLSEILREQVLGQS
jgi:NRPS condensation-like uncharacterized protein/pimeloyl-ACP methyl ester carboxylesterase